MKRREFLQKLACGASVVGTSACAEGEGTLGDKGGNGGTAEPTLPPVVDSGVGVPLQLSFADGWRFRRDLESMAFDPALDDSAWEAAALPHTARVEALVTGVPGSATYQWQGICWYRRRFTLPPEADGRRLFLRFEGAMNVAEVWLDGLRLGQHLGGYLPFGFDVSDMLRAPGEHVLACRLDNRDNAITGPKPLSQLDFNMYGGLYRGVRLEVKSRLYITDPILADKVGGGGVLVTFLAVSPEEATIAVKVHVMNADVNERRFSARCALMDTAGNVVLEATSEAVSLPRATDTEVLQTLTLRMPALWSPREPHLYTLRVELVDGEDVVDSVSTRIGIRRIAIGGDGFFINGERMFLRGTNRHQEYPYIGYALSADAQYRDAKKIKDAGFDFVRLSHYPHDPAFLDACDELGLVVMNCIPGWQYFNPDPQFAALQYDNCRMLVRRDRHHPCVVLWEASLNETEMPADFIARTHAITHEEYPGDQSFTSGWRDGYDVFIQARQHGGCRGIAGRACLVSEYGDWEYYADNAGFNQTGWQDLTPDDRNSRQLRWHGERALVQQATNFQEAAAGNRQTIAFADGLWVMFDYNRGYAPDIESSGCMDLFRLPKFSYYFFQSQRGPGERYELAQAGPMVFIASFWTPASSLAVRVFSNCDSVALYLNGTLLERRAPDQGVLANGLEHPPFSFDLASFVPGTLEAVAFIGENEAARHSVRTPGPATTLALWLDEGGRPFATGGKDTMIVHAELRDDNGTIVPDAWQNVFFGVEGAAMLVGANPFSTDAGTASILLESAAAGAAVTVFALALLSEGGSIRVLSGTVTTRATPPAYEVRATLDGSAPDDNAALYTAPVTAPQLRAALFSGGQRLIDGDSNAPLFRVQGSRAPT